MSTFALSLSKFAEKTEAKIESTVKLVMAGMAESLIEMSPVGDPEYWAINDKAQFQRDALQAARTESGKAPLSNRTLKKHFPNASRKGYVGGRFRANWDYGIGSIPQGQYDTVDKTGAASRDRIAVGISGVKMVGSKHFIVNNLPYAQRLEDGWSRQAPHGMVGLTVLKFETILNRAARS